MKRRTKKTFFELKVALFFDLFDFWIGGYYDYKKKALYLSLIPTLVIRLENTNNLISKIGNVNKNTTPTVINPSVASSKTRATGGIISKSKGAVI